MKMSKFCLLIPLLLSTSSSYAEPLTAISKAFVPFANSCASCSPASASLGCTPSVSRPGCDSVQIDVCLQNCQTCEPFYECIEPPLVNFKNVPANQCTGTTCPLWSAYHNGVLDPLNSPTWCHMVSGQCVVYYTPIVDDYTHLKTLSLIADSSASSVAIKGQGKFNLGTPSAPKPDFAYSGGVKLRTTATSAGECSTIAQSVEYIHGYSYPSSPANLTCELYLIGN